MNVSATGIPAQAPFPPLPQECVGNRRAARVCIASPDIVGPIRNGGIGTAYTALAHALTRGGHHVTILYPFGTHSETQRIEHWVSEYARIGICFVPLVDDGTTRIDGSPAARISYRTYQWLRNAEMRFDVIHFPEWMALGYYSVLAKHQGLDFHCSSIVVGMHSPHFWNAQFNCDPVNSTDLLLLDFMERECARLADVVISPSQYLLNWCLAEGWKFPKNTFVQPYVLPESPAVPAEKSRTCHEVREIVFFGRLERRKGLALACEAIGRSPTSRRKDIRLVFLGKAAHVDGMSALDYIRAKSKEWQCSVQILSDLSRQDALDYLSRPGRLALIASLVDNSPNTVYECLSKGIPFLAAKTGGIPELVHAGDQADICFDADSSSLQDALERAISTGVAPARPAVDFVANELRWNQWHSAACQTAADPVLATGGAKTPKVSVCLIHFNRPHYLAQALESLRRQTYSNFEVVLVDDGSTNPNALGFLDALEQEFRDRHWRILRKENGGPGAARNLAAANSAGEYLLFMDDDNIAVADEIATLLGIAQHTNADIVTSPSFCFVGDVAPDEDPRWIYLFAGAALAAGAFSNVFGDANCLVRKGAFHALGGFAESRHAGSVEDWELFARAVFSGLNLECAARPLFKYRRSANRPDESQRPENQMRIARVYQARLGAWALPLLLLAQQSRCQSSPPSLPLLPSQQKWLKTLKALRRRTRPVRYWIMRKTLPDKISHRR